MVNKGVILRWIQYLKECMFWISLEAFSHLLDLIKQDHWIVGFFFDQGSDYHSW